MARILIVGCGCRGRELATALVGDRHAVRGTTRSPERLSAIEAVGAEAVLCDPNRLGTLMPALAGVSAVCWLLGSARGAPAAITSLHGPRLASLLELIVDTPVRGVVYEASGTVPDGLLDEGSRLVRTAARTHRMPVQVVDREPQDNQDWLTAMQRAVDSVLSG